MVTNAEIITKHFLTVSLHAVLTHAREPFPALYAGKRLFASTSSHVLLSFAWAPEPLVTIITFPAFLVGKRLLAGMGHPMPIPVGGPHESFPANVTQMVWLKKQKRSQPLVNRSSWKGQGKKPFGYHWRMEQFHLLSDYGSVEALNKPGRKRALVCFGALDTQLG